MNPSRYRSETVLGHLKYVAPNVDVVISGARVTGASVRVVGRVTHDGRRSIGLSFYERIHRARASGKVFVYWAPRRLGTLKQTKTGMVVATTRQMAWRGVTATKYVFDDAVVRAMVEKFVRSLSDFMRNTESMRWELETLQGPALDSDDYRHLTEGGLDERALTFLGQLPDRAERFPLLYDDERRSDVHAGLLNYPDAAAVHAFLDAHDYAQVAKNVFGVTRYRKPMAALMSTMKVSDMRWFATFRGCVPPEWIIESMRQGVREGSVTFGVKGFRMLRSVVRALPQQVLRRILAEPTRPAQRALRDAVWSAPDVDLALLPDIIAQRGQRNIRTSRDVENLVRSLPKIVEKRSRSQAVKDVLETERMAVRSMRNYNDRVQLLGRGEIATWEKWKDSAFREAANDLIAAAEQELMTARERERQRRAEEARKAKLERERESHEWATRAADAIDGLQAGAYRFVVARKPETLTKWGATMSNCIGGYTGELGLNVYCAVTDRAGAVRLNLEITREEGIVQMLGKYNRDAADEIGHDDAQQVLDALLAVPDVGGAARDALGIDRLRLSAA